MSAPTPDDSYPESWKPRHIKEREREAERQREEFEMHVSALSDEDLKRIRGDR